MARAGIPKDEVLLVIPKSDVLSIDAMSGHHSTSPGRLVAPTVERAVKAATPHFSAAHIKSISFEELQLVLLTMHALSAARDTSPTPRGPE